MRLFSIIDKVWKNEPVSNRELGGLLRWLLSEDGRREYEGRVQEEWERFSTDRTRDYSKFLEKINTAIDARERARKKPRLGRWGRVAAIVIPIVVAAGIYYMGGRGAQPRAIARIESEPTLTMPDGSKIVLDRATANGRVAEEGNVAFVREGGRLIQQRRQEGTATSSEARWGTIEVPRGALFDMVLEDGTQVWLNAGSRLRFPLEFTGGERRVFLEGEAYFAVARNEAMPFEVETPRQSVSVLGTEFNVCAYRGDEGESTTLVRGSVAVRADGQGAPVTLAPGQRAELSPDRGLFVETVDTGTWTSWREGVFVLDGNTLKEVFVRMARWYDIDYTFEDEALGRLTLSGTLPQSEELGPILRVIASVAEVEIEVRGSNVRINKK
jgi:ferric-dicitrate binding protein FerR (iron transport regulator)